MQVSPDPEWNCRWEELDHHLPSSNGWDLYFFPLSYYISIINTIIFPPTSYHISIIYNCISSLFLKKICWEIYRYWNHAFSRAVIQLWEQRRPHGWKDVEIEQRWKEAKIFWCKKKFDTRRYFGTRSVKTKNWYDAFDFCDQWFNHKYSLFNGQVFIFNNTITKITKLQLSKTLNLFWAIVSFGVGFYRVWWQTFLSSIFQTLLNLWLWYQSFVWVVNGQCWWFWRRSW